MCANLEHPNGSIEPFEPPVSPMSVTPFCAAELQRALTEQAFAIRDFIEEPTPPDEARASIVLLEGNAIDIQLTMQGYTIVGHSNSGTVYETLEDLLRTVSPLYTEKQQEAIVNALSRLS